MPRTPQLTEESAAGPEEVQGTTHPCYFPASRDAGSQQLVSNTVNRKSSRKKPQVCHKEGMVPFGKCQRIPQLLWDISRMHRAGIWCSSRHFEWCRLNGLARPPGPTSELLSQSSADRRGSLDRGTGSIAHCVPGLIILMGMKYLGSIF